MNLAGLAPALTRNKGPLAIAGAALVGVLAWRARTAKTTPSSATPLPAGTSSYPLSTSAGYASTGSGVYNSGATDVYSAIQPQLEALGQTQAQLKDMMGQIQTPPIPVPAPTPTPTPAPAPDPTPAPPAADQWRESQINTWYQQFLHRPASTGELTNWNNDITSGKQTLSGVNAAIANSREAAMNK